MRSCPAFAEMSCPEPLRQIATDLKVQLKETVGDSIDNNELKTEQDIETIETDVIHTYPNADAVALMQNTLSIICSTVLSSSDYDGEFKKLVVNRMIDTLRGAITRPPIPEQFIACVGDNMRGCRFPPDYFADCSRSPGAEIDISPKRFDDIADALCGKKPRKWGFYDQKEAGRCAYTEIKVICNPLE
jgi:hypothetical protein